MPRRGVRPKTDGAATEQVAVRLPASLLGRIDRHAQRLKGEVPGWVTVTRADAIRALLMAALDQAEGKAGRG